MDSGYYYIMMIYTVRMFGISMVMMPIMTNGLNQLPMISNPHGTAMNNTLQQVSGAIGSAILLTIMTKRMESAGAGLFAEAQASGNAPTTAEGLAVLKQATWSTSDAGWHQFFVLHIDNCGNCRVDFSVLHETGHTAEE